MLILFYFLNSQTESQGIQNEINIPEGYIELEKFIGDLNEDGQDDTVVLIKDTQEEMIILDKYRGELDRNRRGILIYFNKGEQQELVLENLDCFSSENEDGGVYFAPELWLVIENGILEVQYGHGRYGWWEYKFRYQNNDFELIGFESSSNRGPYVESQTSINFSTKRKLTRQQKNLDYTDDHIDEFEETWEDIEIDELIKLSEVEDFDDYILWKEQPE